MPRFSAEQRTSTPSYDEVYRFSVAPWRLLECLSPSLSGPFLDRWPARTSLEGELSWVATLYAGIVPLGSFAVALWNFRRKPGVRGWAVILFFAYLASLGGFGACGMVRHIAQRLAGINPPIFYEHGDEVGGVYWFLVTFVPGYEGFRYPAKWLTPFGLAFSQLAAIGFQDFVRAAGTHRRLLPVGIVLAAAATAAAAAAAGPQASDVILGGAVTIVLAFVACVILRRAAHAPSDHAALRSSAHLLLCVTAIDLVVTARFNMYNAPFVALSEGRRSDRTPPSRPAPDDGECQSDAAPCSDRRPKHHPDDRIGRRSRKTNRAVDAWQHSACAPLGQVW